MHFNSKAIVLLSLIVVALFVYGCASTGAPKSWLPTAIEAPLNPYGSWITVELKESKPIRYLGGEFLAVGVDSIYVLISAGSNYGTIQSIAKPSIKKATTASFDPEMENATGWVMVGTLSSASHGLGAIVTAPLWLLIGGLGGAGVHSTTPLDKFPRKSWEELRKNARFPQGPPPGLYQLGLTPKDPWAEQQLAIDDVGNSHY